MVTLASGVLHVLPPVLSSGQLIGAYGTSRSELDPDGVVHVGGQLWFGHTAPVNRPDVAQAKGIPALSASGYRAVLDASAVPDGEYDMNVICPHVECMQDPAPVFAYLAQR